MWSVHCLVHTSTHISWKYPPIWIYRRFYDLSYSYLQPTGTDFYTRTWYHYVDIKIGHDHLWEMLSFQLRCAAFVVYQASLYACFCFITSCVQTGNYLDCSGGRCYEINVNMFAAIRIYPFLWQFCTVKHLIFYNILRYIGSLCPNLWCLVSHHQLTYPLLLEPSKC